MKTVLTFGTFLTGCSLILIACGERQRPVPHSHQSTPPLVSMEQPSQPSPALNSVPNLARERLRPFESQFVQIPAGFLPAENPGGELRPVAQFQADRYPVTRELWSEIMDEIPNYVPQDLRVTWDACPRCPVTHVNWENADFRPAEVQDFLGRLNQRLGESGCHYDLPTDFQLWYMIRADETGTNADRFSRGVTDHNVDQYVTSRRNSNTHGTGPMIQPIGNKIPNDFGIELGNVWKISKDIYDPLAPHWGRSMRGVGWGNWVDHAQSDLRDFASAGRRTIHVGFSLVRTCPGPS